MAIEDGEQVFDTLRLSPSVLVLAQCKPSSSDPIRDQRSTNVEHPGIVEIRVVQSREFENLVQRVIISGEITKQIFLERREHSHDAVIIENS